MQLHDAGNPSFPPIAPVTYMWRPLQHISTNVEGISREVTNEEQNIDNTFTRQLWLWIHAASFREAYDSLSSACGNNVGSKTLYIPLKKNFIYFNFNFHISM